MREDPGVPRIGTDQSIGADTADETLEVSDAAQRRGGASGEVDGHGRGVGAVAEDVGPAAPIDGAAQATSVGYREAVDICPAGQALDRLEGGTSDPVAGVGMGQDPGIDGIGTD